MISVVCVYNDENTLSRILLPSLQKQTTRYEAILKDNTRGQYKSAAQALNEGAKLANGDHVMFVHQDVELDTDHWLADAERLISHIPSCGIAGVAGMSSKGERTGFISNCGENWGTPVQGPTRVQTLDECLLIMPRIELTSFDEKAFDGWHSYGVDYCLRTNAYLLPLFIYHRSKNMNMDNLVKYHRRLWLKHRRQFPTIYTTCGRISWLEVLTFPLFLPPYQHMMSDWIATIGKELEGCQSVLDVGCGYNTPLRYFNIPHKIGVDIFRPYLEESEKKGLHDEYIKADLNMLELPAKSYDAVFCSEVLEHLYTLDSRVLVEKMTDWASKVVIVTMPNGYQPQDSKNQNPFEKHRSSWSVEDLEDMGFRVKGVHGWKSLGDETGIAKNYLWAGVSATSQIIASHWPQKAYRLLGIRRL